MSLAVDRLIPTGTYAIINAEYNLSLAFSEQDQSLSASCGDEYGWTITFLKNKKWTIQGPSDISIDLGPDTEEGEDVIWAKNSPKPHQWVIKRHSEGEQSYIIYSPSQADLFWSLPNRDQGTAPQLSSDHNSAPSLWKFKKIEKPSTGDGMPDASEQFTAGAVHRPRQLASAIQNRVAVVIPPGWLTTITSVACGGNSNLVRIHRTADGALETQDLVSRWDANDKVMTLDGTDSDAVALPSAEESYVLGLEMFHSKNSARKDPRKLPGLKDVSTNLRVFETSRPNDMKSFPDFQTFTIFDESPNASGSGRTQNAIITIHASMKVAVDLNDPGKPDPESVNKGYNEELDRPRPSSMDQWLEKYRVIFIVDDSSAMAVNGAWGKARAAIIRIAAEAMQYDANGIDIYFLNSLLLREGIVARDEVVQIFGQIKPQGHPSMGARLESVLNKIILQLEQAKCNLSDYGQVRPTSVVVLTNSPPSNLATKAIRIAEQQLKRGLHHPNAVGIQFVQIGDDITVEKALQRLSQDPSFNIADSVSFGTKFSPDNLQKAVLGAMHPSVRAKVASSSGRRLLYYRVFNADGAIATKRPAYMDDPYLGCIIPKWVAPPHHAGSLKNCLAAMENIDPKKTRLFATSSNKTDLADDTPVSLNTSQTLGLTPAEPLVLFCEVIPQLGLKPGTESLCVPSNAHSPLTPRFLYYGVFTRDGASSSKKPLDTQEPWVSRVDLQLIPPPLCVVSLVRSIAMNEGHVVPGSSQLFVSSDTMTPLSDDHILVEGEIWLGSTADDYIMFLSRPQYRPNFIEGARYFVRNHFTTRILYLRGDYFTTCPHNSGLPSLQFTFKNEEGGGTAIYNVGHGKWAGSKLQVSEVEYGYHFIPSDIHKYSYFICPDPDHREALHDDRGPGDHRLPLELANLDLKNEKQMWRLVLVV